MDKQVRGSDSRVRWIVLTILSCVSFASYLCRMNISIAAKLIMPDLGLSEVQMGTIFSSFMLGYALFQIPAGMLGDRFGPRIVLTAACTWWGIATALTGLIPALTSSKMHVVFGMMITLRFLLGVAEAPTYPVATRAIANWFPSSERALSNSILMAGLALGSSFTPLVISWLMVHLGWRQSFLIVSPIPLIIASIWHWYATDRPVQHAAVGYNELGLILGGIAASLPNEMLRERWWAPLKNRNMFLLFASYLCLGYVFYIFVFWLFLYLVEVRKFSMLAGGMFTSLPWIVAAVWTTFGGWLCDGLSAKLGRNLGRRLVGSLGMGVAGGFLMSGATAQSPYVAVAALCLCVGFVEFTEGAFWASAIDVAGSRAGMAGGILNMGSNIGGAISTALVPILVRSVGWNHALLSGTAVALVGGTLWLWIRSEQPIETTSAV
jgi:ACS family glucarate transporter-like MFS transporter